MGFDKHGHNTRVCVCVCVKERMSNKNVTILHLLYDILVCKTRHRLCVRVAFVSM